MKRCSMLLLATVFAVASQTFAAPPSTQPRKPNILFLLIDDMGYADLSCFGQRNITTPNIDRMASEGVKFTQFYVNAPICSPSRCSLLTGQYPARWHITSYLAERALNEKRGMAQWLDPKAPSLARIFQEHGYATGHFGKWHLGGQRDVGEAPLVVDYGFNKVITSFEGLGDRFLPLLDAFDGKPPQRYGLGSGKLGRGTITWIDRSKITTAWTDAAIAFINVAEKRDQPFYINLWPDDVHSPFFPPAALRGDSAKKTLYLGVTKALDEQVAVIFNRIRDDPVLRDNTLIVIASDNGPEPGAGSAGEFRGHKGNLWEGGIREPLIVWGPGLLSGKAAGTTDETSVIAGMDLLPSLLSIAKIALPNTVVPDGEDRSAAMLGEPLSSRAKAIYWLRPPDRPGTVADRWPDLAMRDGEWKLLCMFDGSSPQLYDLTHDPAERHNLADASVDRVTAMRTSLLNWFAAMPAYTPQQPTTEPQKTDG